MEINNDRDAWMTATKRGVALLLLLILILAACTQGSPDGAPPAAPSNVVATAINGEVVLTWDGNPDVASYRVYRSLSTPVDTSGAPVHISPSSETEYTDRAVVSGTAYYYVVIAVDASGNVSASSDVARATLAASPDPASPAAPTNLTATVVDNQVVLSWDSHPEPGIRYSVYRSMTEHVDLTGAPANSAPLTANEFADTNVNDGVTYYYVVTAVDANGNESAGSNIAYATLEETPVPGSQGAWYRLAPSSPNRAEVSYVQVGGKFYLAGGSHLHEVYDPVTDSWDTVARLPIWLDHIQAVVLDGLIYYIGGLRGWPGPQSDRVYIYNPVSDTFTQGANMPSGRARGAGGTAVYDGKIYYAGGMHGSIEDTVAVPWFDVYDPATESWQSLPDMPTVRDHFHAAVVDGVFYAIGGRNRHDYATTPVVDAYDFATGTWSTLPTELPTERGGFATAVLGQEILIIGGERRQRMAYDTVEAYNTVTNTWRTLAPMLTGRHGIQAAVCNGGVYIAAGGEVRGGDQHTNKHDVFFLDSPAPCLPE